jgi:hypothetical protein
MERDDWLRVIAEAAQARIPKIQFIGGEPTLHPDLALFIQQALNAGLKVEVYSNLVRVSDKLWAAFCQPGVELATSFYTDDPVQHARITRGGPTWHHTLRNIEHALALGLPLRVGMVRVLDDQRLEEGRTLLADRGVRKIGVDSMRILGRPDTAAKPDVKQLCGNCALSTAAVLPTGEVTPCPLGRWMRGKDVREVGLTAALEALAPHRTYIQENLPQITMCGPDNDGQWDRFGMTVTPDAQYVWLDHSNGVVRL